MEQSPAELDKGFDKINAVLAGITALIAFIIYYSTVAPMLSYWDCGEFITCAHVMGNPHPPGTPLFMLVGRFFDLLPTGDDVGFRINLMSSVSSTFTCLFAYLIIVRLVSSWYQDRESYRLGRIIAYASGFIGALFVAFSRANWNNSVETEPRSMAIMLLFAIFWLGLKWFSHRYSPQGKRIILLASFLSMLAVGVHLTVFLVVPIMALFFSLKEEASKRDWAMVSSFFVIELLLIFALVGDYSNYKAFLGISLILFCGLAFLLRQKVHWPILISFASMSLIMVGFYPFLYAVTGWFVISLIVYFIRRETLWSMASLILLAGAIGWSVHVYIPIRSTNHPIIDENTPSRDFRTFVNFLDRKQYGSMSMTERMFVRRGAWANQFGDHDRMGFWYLFKDQYSSKEYIPIFVLIGLFGLATMAYKNPRWGYSLIILLLLASAGLVLYMNFADGTHFNSTTGDAYQEVRNRYYFFTPAFVFFAIGIGLGMGGIMELIRKYTAKMGASTQKMAVYISLIFVLLPGIPLQASYFSNDRSQNRMAYSYAYNLLNSCEENAILFTSGDNDTFPVWCVQEVYGIRKDVRVVNFSLLNTDWYIWQLKNFQGVPISLEDDQILWEPFTLPGGQVISKPVRPFVDKTRQRQTYLIPMPHEGKLVKVAAMMLDDIILTNKWKYPIYFSSASGEVRNSPLKLLDRCYREGLVLRLTTDNAMLQWNVEKTDSLFFKEYLYSNISDTLVAQNENATGIALAIPEKMLDYHQYVLRQGDTAKADSLIDRICEAVPSYWRSRLTQRDVYIRKGDSIRAMEITREMFDLMHGLANKNPGNIFFQQFLGMAYYSIDDKENAEKYLTQAWDMNHDKEHTFRALLTLYAGQRRPADMLRVARDFKLYHNENKMANDVIQSAQYLMQTQPPIPKIKPMEPFQALPPATVPSESAAGGN